MIAKISILLLIVLLASSCAAPPTLHVAAEQSNVEPKAVPHLGGPLYRVFDVDEIDSIDALYAVELIYRAAEQCTGIERDFAPVRVFFVSKIMIQRNGVWLDSYAGMRTWERPWIFVQRSLGINQIAWTMKHEFIHYITDLGHPESDDVLRACGVFREAEEQ